MKIPFKLIIFLLIKFNYLEATMAKINLNNLAFIYNNNNNNNNNNKKFISTNTTATTANKLKKFDKNLINLSILDRITSTNTNDEQRSLNKLKLKNVFKQEEEINDMVYDKKNHKKHTSHHHTTKSKNFVESINYLNTNNHFNNNNRNKVVIHKSTYNHSSASYITNEKNYSSTNSIDFNFNKKSKNSSVIEMLQRTLIGFILYALTIWTVIGNIFVCIALYTNKQLKQGGISNYLIGNLALSDLLLGLTVLPFSATYSTFQNWVFGSILCDAWLSIDVLCCTASIWGLLVISLDRYIATNHPIIYRKQKNSLKVALVYCTISWVISIGISLVPLFFLDSTQPSTSNSLKNSTQQQQSATVQSGNLHSSDNGTHTECILFQKPSFVILSSLGSFYLPLVLMILLYSKVFIRIRQQSKLFHNTKDNSPNKKQSSTQTELATKSASGSKKNSTEFTSNKQLNKSLKEKNELLKKKLSVRLNRSLQSNNSVQLEMNQKQTEELLPKKQSDQKEESSSEIVNKKVEQRSSSKKSKKAAKKEVEEDNESISSIKDTIQTASLLTSAIAAMPISIATSVSCNNMISELENNNKKDPKTDEKNNNTTITTTTSNSSSNNNNNNTNNNSSNNNTNDPNKNNSILPRASEPSSERALSINGIEKNANYVANNILMNVTANLNRNYLNNKKPAKPLNRSISNSEARVTKTLAIIMFCFVACWLPFFSIYIVRSQLEDTEKIPGVVLDIFIWLGYFNSALNPILYAILNRNFRIAFKDILACRCFKRF